MNSSFTEYLSISKSYIRNILTEKSVKLVMGNESCDLDSTVSTLAFAYFLHKYRNEEGQKVIALINIGHDDFMLRSVNCCTLKEMGINFNWLTFRNDVDLEKVNRKVCLNTHLVDHHVLSVKDLFLKNTVRQIIDHRPLDITANWSENVEIFINQVGSCATLVANEFMKTNESIDETIGKLLYYAIIFDTAALADNGRTKELDKLTVTKLKAAINLETDDQKIYEELWKVYKDVSNLTPKQLLTRDLKLIEGVPVPALPMLVSQFLKLPEAEKQLQAFAKEHNSPLVVLVGIEVSGDTVKRDIALFGVNCNDLVRLLEEALLKCECSNGETLGVVRRDLADFVVYFEQMNVKASRKQVVPVVKEVMMRYKEGCCS